MIQKVGFFGLLLILFTALWQQSGAADDKASAIEFKVTQLQRSGVAVGADLLVEGTASLPAGHFLWVLARPFDSNPPSLWWPKAEGVVNSETGNWKVRVTIGKPEDVGKKFAIAVAVFEEPARIALQKHLRESEKSGKDLPIEMPEVTALQIFQVMKVSHRP